MVSFSFDKETTLFHAELSRSDKLRAWVFRVGLPCILIFLFSVALYVFTHFPIFLIVIPPLIVCVIQTITLCVVGISGIALQKDKILYRNLLKNEWKVFEIEEMHHASYNMAVRKADILPIVRLFSKEFKSVKDLQLWLHEREIYKFLSVLHRMGYPVLLFEEDKNIDETEYYWRGDKLI